MSRLATGATLGAQLLLLFCGLFCCIVWNLRHSRPCDGSEVEQLH